MKKNELIEFIELSYNNVSIYQSESGNLFGGADGIDEFDMTEDCIKFFKGKSLYFLDKDIDEIIEFLSREHGYEIVEPNPYIISEKIKTILGIDSYPIGNSKDHFQIYLDDDIVDILPDKVMKQKDGYIFDYRGIDMYSIINFFRNSLWN